MNWHSCDYCGKNDATPAGRCLRCIRLGGQIGTEWDWWAVFALCVALCVASVYVARVVVERI